MVREEESFLQDVTEKIKKRIEKIDQTLLTGQKRDRKHARLLLGKLYGNGPVRI